MKNKKQNWINLFKEQKANNQIKVYVKHPYLLIEDTLPKFIVDYIKQEKKNKVFSATNDINKAKGVAGVVTSIEEAKELIDNGR
jgi:hypothetical protein